MDELWELWTGAGLDEFSQVERKITLDAALNDLGFTEEEQRHPANCGTYRRVSLGDIDDDDTEGLFNNCK